MKKKLGAILALSIALLSTEVKAELKEIEVGKKFTGKVLIENLEAPWDLVWGADNNLWITERQGKNISKINPETGERKILYTVSNAFVGPQHEGVLGLALEPNFLKGKSNSYVYTAYTYKDEAGKEFARIIRLTYDVKNDKLKDEKIVLDKLPASDDHNSGRLRFGKDGKLYYTIGDQGANQGKHQFEETLSQYVPTAEEVAKKDYSKYPGSTLRLNTDGTIPSDNPVINGVKSHIYTYGHRNAQGLVFVGDKLFSTEHGPSSDDELNLLEAGKNYGWPNVAGYKDDQAYKYTNYSLLVDKKDNIDLKDKAVIASITQNETDFKAENYKNPIKTFFTVNDEFDFSKAGSYLNWPTIAPSSVEYYPENGLIEEWRNSLLISSLKNGAIYRVRLNADRTNVQGDSEKLFKTNNRYRAVLVSPDSTKIFIATDNNGGYVDTNGNTSREVQNKGAILIFEYNK